MEYKFNVRQISRRFKWNHNNQGKKTFETFCIISVTYILKYVQETKMFIIIIIIIIIIISWL